MRRLAFLLLMLAPLVAPAATSPFGVPDDQFLALCYHDVRDEVTAGRDADPYAVSTRRLTEWFDWMAANDWHPVSLQQIVDARQGGEPLPDNAVLLTFDDGLSSLYSHVFPLLQAYDYPALFALQTGWLQTVWSGASVDYGAVKRPAEAPATAAGEEAPASTVVYNDRPRGASGFVSPEQIRRMQTSGLVEFASHSHDLHRGILANPQGNMEPAAITRRYDPASDSYESDKAFRNRIRVDLERSADAIEAITGVAPRAIVWPYGAHSAEVDRIAAEVGMPWSFSLGSEPLNRPGQPAYGRLLITDDPTAMSIARETAPALAGPAPQRAVHVDLDYVYDPDPEQTNANLGRLLDRIKRMQVKSVYLQAFADPDGDGNAAELYFPNRHLPMRADLFNRVSWQLRTRAGVRVYAWMPLLAFDLPEAERKRRLSVSRPGADGQPVPAERDYRRLSPFLPESVEIVGEIYADLGKAASGIAGVLIHDDAYLAADEDLTACRETARWPGTTRPLDTCRLDAGQKTRALIDFGTAVIERLRYHVNQSNDFRTARNLYARVVLDPSAEARFAQSLPAFASAYDEVAIMAMPWLDGTDRPANEWLGDLADAVEAQLGGFDDVVFELQARDWRGEGRWIEAETLRAWMQQLVRRGALNLAYYPDDFLNNRPRFEPTYEGMSLNAFPHRR
ncbi:MULTISPECIES: poly-beta-1,6-N-acetyl-D-glucosamine N-deacetylase PgaB [unclassified Guyparkeria]|uniref:poly-beta-1,6-N-acetyl-D-glucosamine N-deacetylase PgaB n=1 Tax=unclassified Guyparkeria TaxID=2626246 RepID=UPI000733556B|nr:MULTISPECIES: poly-beta-1,6-N-acetyl-D-glucosamine N-deacetylase PgaB [unclassified Guyparkeria]KTG17137.1 hemin storage protein [Guyparkeria sp. XI15]OAE86672.1 hemin storage protein [Guyparkeria sp. WRN-7]